MNERLIITRMTIIYMVMIFGKTIIMIIVIRVDADEREGNREVGKRIRKTKLKTLGNKR